MKKHKKFGGFIFEKCLPLSIVSPSCVMMRREFFDQVGLFREDLQIMVDTELCVRVLAAGFESGVLRQPLAIRRLHHSQITRDYTRAFAESMITMEKAGIPDNLKNAYHDDRIAETADYLIKSLEPSKARDFLKKSKTKNFRYFKLHIFSLLPASLLFLLRWLRQACLKIISAINQDEESRQADKLMRSILAK